MLIYEGNMHQKSDLYFKCQQPRKLSFPSNVADSQTDISKYRVASLLKLGED